MVLPRGITIDLPSKTPSSNPAGIKITWGKVTGAAKYQVYCKVNNASSWKNLALTSATSYTWKKAENGAAYRFTVRGVSKDGKTFTSAYNSGKSIQLLTNGKLATEKNIPDLLNTLRSKYPTGMPFDGSVTYRSVVLGSGGGRSAFAFLFSDTVFGDLTPSRRHSDFDKLRPGDHVRIDTPHSMIVLEKRADSIIITEGNNDGLVCWDREVTRDYLEEHNFYVDTRYAE